MKKDDMRQACGMYGMMSTVHTILTEKLKGQDHLEDLDIDERIALKWVLKKYNGLDSSGSG
jgi:hypothetical protein